MDQGDLTITKVNFDYFFNTKANKSLAFGPGLLRNNAIEKPTMFYIQARDKNNENRQSGDDIFRVKIKKLIPKAEDEE